MIKFLRILLFVLFLAFGIGIYLSQPSKTEIYIAQLPPDSPMEVDYHTSYTAPYTSQEGDEEASPEVQCPIPMKDRVKNHTGIQCVFSSIEMLGRWAEEPKLTNPPITSRSNCKSYSGPDDAGRKLRALGVKYEQSYGNRQKGVTLIKKAMAENRGCLFGVPGHAMVLIHYDETQNTVKWVNNSDRSLKIQTTTIKGFHNMWKSWVLVIYADVDIIPAKMGKLPRQIPIRDHDRPDMKHPDDFIPIPRRKAA